MLKNLLGAGKRTAKNRKVSRESIGSSVGTKNEEVRDLWIAAALKKSPQAES
jgi:hypothetical protein